MSKAPKRPVLKAEELPRAIFIDYEGNKPAPGATSPVPPTLLGYMVDGEPRTGIVEPLFAERCSGKRKTPGAVAEDHRALVERLLTRAEEEVRVLVSWSRHDLDHMVHAAPKLESRLSAVHRNAIKPVRRHFSRLGKPLPPKQAKLYEVCTRLRIPVVEKFGTGLVGKNLRILRAQFERGVTYDTLSTEHRHAWQKIVKHNRQDLVCMRDVLEKVLGSPEYSTTEERGRPQD